MTHASQQLPVPALEDTPEKTQFVQAANERVMETAKKSRKRERGNYGHYTLGSRAEWACERGNSSVTKRFSKELMRGVNESTVRTIKNNI